MDLKTLRLFEYLLEFNQDSYEANFDANYWSSFASRYSKNELLDMYEVIKWSMENPDYDFNQILLSKRTSNAEFFEFLKFLNDSFLRMIESKKSSNAPIV